MSDLSTRPPEHRPRGGREYSVQIPLWYVFGVAVMLMAILIVVLLLLVRDDNGQVETIAPTVTTVDSQTSQPTTATTSQASSSQATTATTASSTTTTATTAGATTATTASSTTAPVDQEQYRTAVWPDPASTVRYNEPTAAARGFAVDFLGFQTPIVGPFLQGDSRSGEVELRPTDTGPVTTVLVRQLDATGSWWILGSVTENISIDSPDALQAIGSPLVVSGSALAFEGVVGVQLRADGSNVPLVDGSVIGGGTSREPFEGSFEWTNPGKDAGALILMTTSMEDGRPWEAAVLRVSFAGE